MSESNDDRFLMLLNANNSSLLLLVVDSERMSSALPLDDVDDIDGMELRSGVECTSLLTDVLLRASVGMTLVDGLDRE
jgi:hypothetical protein